MTAVMTTVMPFNEEIRTVFCTDRPNMTNNIQYGVTSHYSSMWDGNWMGFTICIPNISQWRGFTEGGSGVV